MRAKRHLLLCAAAALLAGAGTPFAQPAPATGQAGMQAMIGNTVIITGSQSGKDVTYYFLADGTLKGMATGGNRVHEGRWRLDGDRLCTSDRGGQDPFCLAFTVSGETVQFTDAEGRRATGTILKGNARNM